MGLRVNTNVVSLITQKTLRKNQREVEKNIERIATGKRINRGMDDSAGMAIASKLESEVASLRQASRNANQGIAVVQTAEGALDETSSMVVRLRELAIQSANDILSDEERSLVNIEFQQLKQEIERIALTTTFNDRKVLMGSEAEIEFQVGTHATENDKIKYGNEFIDATTSGLGLSGATVESKTDSLESLEVIDEATKKIGLFRASLGATQRRLQTAANAVDSRLIGAETSKSIILDTDYAKTSSDLVAANIKKAGAISVLSQANYEKESALRLIK